ncbi:MAG: mandelate racemase/muconate lactonizing enzyme family protein [Acidobacteria bacterium]|nr:mandelate racemase/muconate lactonizing enzyme family protein [Acidobacteriota bacterium]
MKIQRVQVGHYNVPLETTLSDSTHGDITHFALVTARISTACGVEGLGYTYTVGKTGGAAVRAHLEYDIAPWLIGEDPRRTEQLWWKMWSGLHYAGRGGAACFAISAADTALWDVKARSAGEPLWRFLGGHDPRVKVYAGGIDLMMPLDQLREQTHANLARGFRAIKMKVGRPRLADDLERVAAVREILGPEMPLMVDANMRWSPEEAIRAARALRQFDVFWLEEPIIPDDVDGHVRVARDGGVSIATGENMHTLYEFQKAVASGAVAFPEPDLSNVGGVTAWMKVARLAEAFNLPVTTHGVHDLHVHLLAAVPNASYLEAHGFGLERFLRHPMEIRDGVTIAPDRPGHGVEIDWAALEAVRA